jgi:glycosidase
LIEGSEIMTNLLSFKKVSSRIPLFCLGVFLTDGVAAGEKLERPWKDDVIYFVMTDRFHDGDPENNIPTDSDPGLYDARQENINLYHGGDFRGLEKALKDGYFTDLGITAIWITPPVRNVWMSLHDLGGSKSGYHGYWAQDFRDIDPHLTSRASLSGKPYAEGPAGRLQHYRDLIKLAHSNGIKIVQDVVCNHMGPVFYYDLNGNGDHDGDPGEWMPPYKADGSYHEYVRWADEPQWNTLEPPGPELFLDLEVYGAKGFNWDSLGKQDGEEKRCDFLSLRTFNTSPDAPHFDRLIDQFVDIYHFYIDELGVDGLRVDTVKHVDKEFWDAFFSRLRKRLGPDAEKVLFFGEVYGNSIGDINYYAGSSTGDGKVLDSLLNFQFTWAVRDVLRHETLGDIHKLASFIERMNREVQTVGRYDAKDMRLHSVNFIGNHDGLNRFLVQEISEENHDLALAVLLTFEGIPCIYYGSELAMRDDKVDRHRDSETGRTTLFDNRGRRRFDARKKSPHFKMVSELTALRRQFPALVDGDIRVFPLEEGGPEDGVLAYRRGSALVVLNAAKTSRRLAFPAATLLYSNGAVKEAKPILKTRIPGKTLQVYRLQ